MARRTDTSARARRPKPSPPVVFTPAVVTPAVVTPVVFTIVSANYIAYAATLMQSLRQHQPQLARYIVLADAPQDFPGIDLAAELIPCAALGIDGLANMTFWYSVIELNTAIKPFAFLHLLGPLGFTQAIYLDPDIVVYAPLAPVLAALDGHGLVLTPHMLRPLQDGREPSDLTILRSGVYNLGFLAVAAAAETLDFLRWWAARCHAHCRVDVAAGIFTDQRWMDLAPAFIARVAILRDTACNVAYWNIPHRTVAATPNGFTVDGAPLVFFHFSGIVPDEPEVFSKHQTRYTAADLPPAVTALCDDYRARVVANGWTATRRRPYAFAHFANGRPIEDFMRRWVLRAIDEGRLDPAEPLRIGSEFFDEEDEAAAARGIVLTRFMHQFWRDREDLRRVFDIETDAGLESYITWFLGDGGAEQGIDPRSIAAAALLYDREESAEERARRTPSWPPVAATHWDGPSSGAAAFIAGDIRVEFAGTRLLLPRQAALAWERRIDLRSIFAVNDAEGLGEYVAWALTSGCADGSVDPALFTAEFTSHLAGLSALSAYYRDVPLTEGMMLTRRVPLRRDFLDGWLRFPVDRGGRLAHALWYAKVAASAYAWPTAVAEPVNRFLDEPGDIVVGGFALSRAALAVWELRPDLQASFPLRDEASRWRLLFWLVTEGLRELDLTLDAFDPRLRPALAALSPRLPGVPMLLEMVHAARPDLQRAFDTASEAGRAALVDWAHHHLAATYPGAPLLAAFAPPPAPHPRPVAAPHRAKIGLTGQWSAPSGRGEDLRCTARALAEAGWDDLVIIDRDTLVARRPDGTPLPPGDIEVEINVVHLNADTAYDDWRALAAAGVSARRSVGYWAWELERLPASWRHAFSFYDEIWAATRFAYDAFLAEALRPVTLVPLAVIPPHVTPMPRAALDLPEAATVFFFMFDFRSYASRKNPEAAIAAFERAFADGTPNVRLLIKTQGGAGAPASWRRLNALCTDPRIDLRDAAMTREALDGLIAAADVFVSLHRSEGFGRGPAEAMLLAKPVILTDYSGTADFADASCACPVPYTLREVLHGEYPGVEGQRWADADIDAAASWMRRLHEQPELRAAIGARARARILRGHAPGVIGPRVLAALGLATAAAAKPRVPDRLPSRAV